MDINIIKLITTIIFIVDLTPQQLSALGLSLSQVVACSIVVYWVRMIIEIILYRLGFDVMGALWKLILSIFKKLKRTHTFFTSEISLSNNKKMPYTIRLLRYWRNMTVKNGNKAKDKLIKFFQALGYIGMFLANAAPFMPTSVSAVLYNLKQKHQGNWYEFNNLSFLALTLGGCVRMILVLAAFYGLNGFSR